MNCLIIADTFPNALDPWRGPYNRRQVECLAAHSKVTVIDPIPWPSLLRNPQLRHLIDKPDMVLEKLAIYHPLFWYMPVAGRGSQWRGLTSACRKALAQMNGSKFDLIMATFSYPHGMAAKQIAGELKIPYAIKARGTDLHSLPSSGKRRELTAEAVRGAAALVAVSGNLAEIAKGLGADPEKIHVLGNGIDIANFRMISREEARGRAGLGEGRIALFVGNLVAIKGLDILLRALAQIPQPNRPLLALAGEGPLRAQLESEAQSLGVAQNVRFLGRLSREDVGLWLNAADILVLSSRNEGCPNVVLEALACGTPVISTRVGAVPEIIDIECGRIVPTDNPSALAKAIEEGLNSRWDRSIIASKVQALSWEKNAARLHEILACAAKL